MNHVPITGSNFEDVDKFNTQFCKAVPKVAKQDIIEIWKKLLGNDFVDLPLEDKYFKENESVKSHTLHTIAFKPSSHDSNLLGRVERLAATESNKFISSERLY